MTFACAHRGDSSAFRENTIEAIASAITKGADIVEIDVRLTSAGDVVVLHDSTLERLWGLPQEINRTELETVRKLGYDNVRIPLLADVLKLFIGTQSTLMIDMEVSEPARAAFAVVQEGALPLSQITWCGDLDGMKIIRSLSKEARIWLPWNHQGVPPQSLLDEVKPEFINSYFGFLNRSSVEEMHNLGYKVSAWTVNDLPTMRWAVAIGIDSITSDHLEVLQGAIAENPQYDIGGPQKQSRDSLNLDYAMEVARSLGKWAIVAMTHLDPGEMMLKKNAADIVTVIDLLIETHVREVIAANFIGHSFVGEEFGGVSQSDVPEWYLDPIDGTTNFANRLPWNSFSLALSYNKSPILGVVVHPWLNKLYEAQLGKGARCNGEPLILSQEADKNPLSSRVVSTELAAYQPWPGMLGLLDGLAAHFCTMRIMGSGTLTLTSVAAGQSVGAVIGHFSPIDHLAAVIIVKEAGGVILNEDGEEDLFPARGGVLCATSAAAQPLYEIWKTALTS